MTARQYYSTEALSETTATNSYTAKCTLTFTPDANSDYFIIASAQGSHDTTTGSVRIIIELEDPGSNTAWGCELKPQEYTSPQDWISFFALAKYSAGASPSSITHRILFKSSSATTCRIKNARLIAIKASEADKFASNVNEASISSSTYSTHTTLTFTPGSTGDYLVIGAAAIASDNAGGRVSARLNHSTASTTYGGRDCYVKSDYERRAFAVGPKINLSAVSNTFTLQYHSPDNSTGVTCAYSAILALRLDGFEAAYTNQDFISSPANTAQTSYQDALTVTTTPAAVAHLIVATGHQRINSNTISGYQQLITDNPSTTFSEYTQEGVNASSYYGDGLAAITTPAASTANWKWQYKCESSSTAYAADLAIAVLQLEAGSTTGSASPTVAALTSAVTATETFSGTATPTIAALTSVVTATCVNPVTGTAIPTIAVLTSTASGAETFSGTATPTVAALTSSTTATETISGTATPTIAGPTPSVTATEAFSGSATPTVAALTSDAAGAESFTGSSASTIADVASDGTGTETFAATATPGVDAFLAEAAAAESFTGSATDTVAAFTSDTTTIESFAGTAADTVAAFAATTAATETFSGTAETALDAFALTAAATSVEAGTFTGAAAPVVGAFISSATATESFAGAAITGVSDSFTSSATADERFIGVAADTFDPFTADASGPGQAVTGDAIATLDVLTSSAFGIEIFTGSFARTIAALFAYGDGWVGTFQSVVQLAGTHTPIFAGRGTRHATTVLGGRRVHASALGGTKTDVTSLGGTIPRNS